MTAILLAAVLASPAAAQAYAVDEDEAFAVPGVLRMGGMNLFTVSDAPLGLLGTAPGEIPKDAVQLGDVYSKACQAGVALPLGYGRRYSLSFAGGKGGFVRALAQLQKSRPEIEGLTDVRVDMHLVSVLWVFQQACIEVTGRAWKRP